MSGTVADAARAAGSQTLRTIACALVLWLCGASLRVTMLAVAPLLPTLVREFGLSATHVGVLSVLPVGLFAAAAVPGAVLIGRIGALRVILVGLFFVLVGAIWRSMAHSTPVLYVSTAVMGAGIAVMHPAMPVAAGLLLPGRAALGTAIYANGLLVWEMLAVSFTLDVLMPTVYSDWRIALLVWCVPVVFALFGMSALTAKETDGTCANAADSDRSLPDWKDARVWLIGIYFGGISTAYFLSNSFIPLFLIHEGLSGQVTPVLVAFNAAQLVASVLLLGLAGWLVEKAWPLFACSSVALLSVLATGIAPGYTAVAAATTGGFVCGAAMILVLALPPSIVPAAAVRRLAAGMFTIGYGVSFALGVGGGAVSDKFPAAWLLLLPIAGVAAAQLLVVRQMRRMRFIS